MSRGLARFDDQQEVSAEEFVTEVEEYCSEDGGYIGIFIYNRERYLKCVGMTNGHRERLLNALPKLARKLRLSFEDDAREVEAFIDYVRSQRS